MKIGQFNTLTIDRDTKVGLFLTDGKEDVLLPNKYVQAILSLLPRSFFQTFPARFRVIFS